MRLARRYYAKLFREYAIVDLSRYKARSIPFTRLRAIKQKLTLVAAFTHHPFEMDAHFRAGFNAQKARSKVFVCPQQEGKVGMRWRSEKEVISGKGQFSCGARGCDESRSLATYEVPFGYEEAGQKKQALVKVKTNTPSQLDAGTLVLDFRFV